MIAKPRAVVSLHCGLYHNWGGGLVVKFLLEGGETRLLAMQSEWVFYLHDDLLRTMTDGKFPDPRAEDDHPSYREVLSKQPDVNPSDFAGLDAASTVNGWSWHAFRDGVIIDFRFARGENELFRLQPEALYLLLDHVDGTIKRGQLVDLRDFRKKSTPEMEAEIAEAEGYRLARRFDHFDLSVRLLEKNYKELITHLETFSGRITNPDFVLWVRRHSLTIFMEEALRLLHNFVAACTSLIDHSRNFYRDIYRSSGQFPEYGEEIAKRFKDDPVSQFVICLRQYAQHYRLPGISTQKQFATEGIQGRVFLLKRDLLGFSRWNAPAKEFLDAQPENIDLVEVVKAYHRKVASFYRWFRRQRTRIHWREFHEAELKRQALLAKRGEEVADRLRERLSAASRPQGNKLLELFSEVLSAEELHQLRRREASSETWLRSAVALASARYPLSEELKAELLALGESDLKGSK